MHVLYVHSLDFFNFLIFLFTYLLSKNNKNVYFGKCTKRSKHLNILQINKPKQVYSYCARLSKYDQYRDILTTAICLGYSP